MMRIWVLTAAAAFALAGCNNEQEAQTDVGATEDLASQNISANDLTAIDAATGDDANMAADAEYNLSDLNVGANVADGNSAEETGNSAE